MKQLFRCVLTVVLMQFAISPGVNAQDQKEQFDKASRSDWVEVFHDPCTGNWRDHWFLDGLKASVKNSEAGMDFSAGPDTTDSSHAVLWTRQSFEGDVRVDYDFTRTDTTIRGVVILYVQATGSGVSPYAKDVSEWAQLREVPSMSLYFNHMNAYHISYAAFDTDNNDPDNDYVRARRYLPETGKALQGTDLLPDWRRTGLFQTGIPHHITMIKMGDDIFLRVRSGSKDSYFSWRTTQQPPILEGRIGLRHMGTRSARYSDFRVSILKDKD
jgi:Domain of unknown function (DUF1961)